VPSLPDLGGPGHGLPPACRDHSAVCSGELGVTPCRYGHTFWITKAEATFGENRCDD
jgi:hypothetical protein